MIKKKIPIISPIFMKIEDLYLHSYVEEDARDAGSSLIYLLEGNSCLNQDLLLLLLTLTPIHVTSESKTGKKQYGCFAGLRSFQLAKTYCHPKQKIRVIRHRELPEVVTSKSISLLDLYLNIVTLSLDEHILTVKRILLHSTIFSLHNYKKI